MTDALAIVLGRGGSRGVPGKNMAMLAGRPCVAWALESARGSARVAWTVLSTDSPELAQVAGGMEVEVVERPAELAGDGARVDDAARHAVLEVERRWGPLGAERPVAILYANVPVRPPGLIERAVEMLVESAADSVQSYCRAGKHHPWWMARLDDEGRVRPWEGDVLNHGVFRRQELPPAYVPDGGVLVVTRRALFCEVEGAAPGPHAFLGTDRRGIATEPGEVVDIDDAVDLIVADAILRRENGPTS